jgi:hypothetical protein
MPMMMGAAMMSRSGDNLARGFWLLVGTQLLTAASGLVLMTRLGKAAGETTQAVPLVERI